MPSATKAGIALTAEARSTQAARWGLGCLHSFASETPVLMADGTSKRIDEVKIGDQVLATDPVTGETTTRPVTATHRHVDTDLTDLTITDGQGNQAILRTTQHHQIWDNTLHTWTDASRLQPGHHLRTPNGETATLSATANFTGSKIMHDLTVESVHTYYVFTGKAPVLVHNTNGCGIWTSTKKKSGVENAFGHYDKHGGDFPDVQNSLQCVRKATDWLNNPTPSTRTRVRGNGDIVRFDPNTKYFGVMTKDGVPKTFYVPQPSVHGYKTNLDYFNVQ